MPIQITILEYGAHVRLELIDRELNMPELEFYCVVGKRKFTTTEWRIVEKERSDGRVGYYAVTDSPFGEHEAWRIVAKKFALKHME